MAEILTYDPSNDPQAVEAREAAEQESLSVAEDLEAQQEEMLAGKYKNAQELEKAYLELQKKLGEDTVTDEDLGEESEEYEETEDESESDPQADVLWKANDEFYETVKLAKRLLRNSARCLLKNLLKHTCVSNKKTQTLAKQNSLLNLVKQKSIKLKTTLVVKQSIKNSWNGQGQTCLKKKCLRQCN